MILCVDAMEDGNCASAEPLPDGQAPLVLNSPTSTYSRRKDDTSAPAGIIDDSWAPLVTETDPNSHNPRQQHPPATTISRALASPPRQTTTAEEAASGPREGGITGTTPAARSPFDRALHEQEERHEEANRGDLGNFVTAMRVLPVVEHGEEAHSRTTLPMSGNDDGSRDGCGGGDEESAEGRGGDDGICERVDDNESMCRDNAGHTSSGGSGSRSRYCCEASCWFGCVCACHDDYVVVKEETLTTSNINARLPQLEQEPRNAARSTVGDEPHKSETEYHGQGSGLAQQRESAVTRNERPMQVRTRLKDLTGDRGRNAQVDNTTAGQPKMEVGDGILVGEVAVAAARRNLSDSMTDNKARNVVATAAGKRHGARRADQEFLLSAGDLNRAYQATSDSREPRTIHFGTTPRDTASVFIRAATSTDMGATHYDVW